MVDHDACPWALYAGKEGNMKLSELLTVINSDTVILVVDKRSISVFHGDVSLTDSELRDWYKSATVCAMYPEYYKGFGKTGITIIIQP